MLFSENCAILFPVSERKHMKEMRKDSYTVQINLDRFDVDIFPKTHKGLEEAIKLADQVGYDVRLGSTGEIVWDNPKTYWQLFPISA